MKIQQFSLSESRSFEIQTWVKSQSWIFVLPLLFLVWMYLFYPFRNILWRDHDEGINLVKAQMFMRGYPLYSDIWNDQPPAFTYLLAGEFHFFGMKANNARILVLLLACLLDRFLLPLFFVA